MREKRLWIQINWRFDQHDMDVENCTNFVANLFTHKLPPVISSGVSKVNIDFTDYPNLEGISKFGSILSITELFPTDIFEQRDLEGKMELLIEETYRCLKLVYQHLKLDIDELESGYNEILNNHHELVTMLISGPKLNKNRSVSATVIAEYFLDYNEIKVDFWDKKSETLSSVPLFKTRSGILFYNGLLHKSKWIDNNTFELTNRTQEINFRIAIDGQINMYYQPIERDIEGIKEEIQFFTSERSFEL
jgi:hypothetical protein